MIINPIWLMDRDLAKEIKDADPEFIICCNFVDPILIQVQKIIQDSGRPCVFIGNHSQYRLDFWAMVCDLYFKHYNNTELELNLQAKKFICLNRKPHAHRRLLVTHLLNSDVADQGHISIGDLLNPVLIDQQFTDDQGINDALPDGLPIKNDVYSLGDVDVWKNSLLCIVTETTFGTENSQDFFISEKTWKPVIGNRPFFIYGQPQLRTYLKEQGFDVFEDIIDYNKLSDHATELDYAQLAVDTISKLSITSYGRLQKRTLRNQQRFQTYVYEQWARLEKLNLQDYL